MRKIYFIVIIPVMLHMAACNKRSIPSHPGIIISRGFDTTQYNLLYSDALKQKMLGNFGDALKYFEQATKMNPASDASYYQISQITAARGDFEQARKYGVKAYKADPRNNWYISNLAALYYQANMPDSVAWYYEELINNDPEREDILFNLGSIYTETGKLDEAEKIFTDLMLRYGKTAQIMIPLVNVYRARNQMEKAEDLLLEVISIEPENLNYRGLLAEFYRSTGNNEKAIDIYRSLFEEDPANGLLQLSYLDFILAEKKYDEVSFFLNTVLINENVGFEDKINLLGKLFTDTSLVRSKSNELIMSVLVLRADNKDEPAAVLALAELYDLIGREADAVNVLKEYTTYDEGNYFIWEKLMFLHNEMQDTKALYDSARKAASLFNMIPVPKLMLAFAATDKGEYELAINELKKVRILVNENPEYMVQVLSLEADIFYRQGKWMEAFEKFDQALEYNPSDPLILNNYAYFMAEKDYDLKKSLSLIEKCISIESNPTYLDTYAWVLYKLGRTGKAEKVMDNMYEKNQINDPELWEHYGYIKRKRGKCDKAVNAWKNALEMDASKEYLSDEINKCIK